MTKSNKPGYFITIEGGEGCGKSTLATRLVSALESLGFSVLKTREPGGSNLSEKIRNLLLHSKDKVGQRAELLLFLAARAQHIEESIQPALSAGKVVICERFDDSTIAYQGCARHLGQKYVEDLCLAVSEQIAPPDCTLLLDLPVEIGRQRALMRSELDRLEKEALSFHESVRRAFLHLADTHKRITVIDASESVDQVFDKALDKVKSIL